MATRSQQKKDLVFIAVSKSSFYLSICFIRQIKHIQSILAIKNCENIVFVKFVGKVNFACVSVRARSALAVDLMCLFMLYM